MILTQFVPVWRGMGVPVMWKAVLAVGAVLVAGPAQAREVKIYSYPSKQNYCPAGLEPVTYDGAISCGTPNQSVTYPSVMRQGGGHKATRPVTRADCQAGVKGCD